MGRVRKGKYLSVQAKEIINSCREFCEEERHNFIWNLETHGSCPHTLTPLYDPVKRTSRACKISRRTIIRLKNETHGGLTEAVDKETSKKVGWIGNKKAKRKPCDLMGGCDLSIVRKTVHKLYGKGSKVPTLQSIYEAVRDEYDFPWGLKTLRSNLNDLGFRWKETENKTKYLMEKSQFITARSQFIRSIRNYRREGYEVIYVGETWIPTNYPLFYPSQLNVDGTDKRLEDTHKITILHAGCKTGFLPNCLLVSESTFAKRAKDDDTRSKEYENWLRHQLIPNLPAKSVIVQGNDNHYCVLSEIVPTSTSLIDEIKNWLSSNYIPYPHDLVKAELLSLVKMHKHRPEFRSDLILKHAGFHTIHLPPLHVDLNPMELVWPFVKSFFSNHNYSTTCTDMSLTQHLFLEACANVGCEQWPLSVAEIIKTEDNYCTSDNAMEVFVSKLESGSFDSGSSSDFTSSESDSEEEGLLNLPQIKKNVPEPRPKGRPRKGKETESSQTKKKVKVVKKKKRRKK